MWFLFACVAEQLVVAFDDTHNFSFSSAIDAQPQIVAAERDIFIEWSGLEYDILGNPVVPTRDIQKLSILLFSQLSYEEVLFGVSNENLRQSDLSGYVEYLPAEGESGVWSTSFSMQGTQLDPQEHLQAEAGTFMLLALGPNEESLMLSFFLTESDQDEEEVSLAQDSATLSYSVDLQGAPGIDVTPAESHVLDWASITQSGTGTPIQVGQIDTLLLAGFSDTELQELEEGFLQLPSIAQEYYTAGLDFQTAIDLNTLSEQGFQGLQTQSLWLVALQCSRCLNPAPLFVAKLWN